MKAYKLKKRYPTLPKNINVGDVVYHVPDEHSPENHPQFWEEVAEQDYEILETETKQYPRQDIISIKRLSDGEVFTVGDKIRERGHDYSFKISRISQAHNTVFLSDNATVFTRLDVATKVKEKYVVCVSNDYSYVPWSVFRCNKEFTNKKHFKHFPTKEKAQEYIDLHKPKYSKKDIEQAFDNSVCNCYGYYKKERVLENLE